MKKNILCRPPVYQTTGNMKHRSKGTDGRKCKKIIELHTHLVCKEFEELHDCEESEDDGQSKSTSLQDSRKPIETTKKQFREDVVDNFVYESINSTSNKRNCGVFVSILVILALTFLAVKPDPQEIPNHTQIADWENGIMEIGKQFPSQEENIWFSIKAEVTEMVTEVPTRPSIFLLLHSDKRTVSCLTHLVGEKATKLLSKIPNEFIVIEGENMKANDIFRSDYGTFTAMYQHELRMKHVMVVHDLQVIPAKLAQSFHVLCDVENPLIKDALFLFTMQIEENFSSYLKPTALAERYLKSTWNNSLDIDILESLIARVTNTVLTIKIEPHLPC